MSPMSPTGPTSVPTPTTASPLAAEAVAGVTDPALRAVVADHWEAMMRWMPTYATTVGDHRYDDQLARKDAASIDRAKTSRSQRTQSEQTVCGVAPTDKGDPDEPQTNSRRETRATRPRTPHLTRAGIGQSRRLR